QHPHAEKRKATGPVTTHKKVNDDSNAEAPVKTLSDRIGLAITKSVGTMWAAYVFFALTLVSLPAALTSGNVIIIVSWVAQTFLQLVLLPIIIVGQNIQAAASDRRAIATYEDAGAILEEAKEIQNHLSDQDQALGHLIDRLEALEAHVKGQLKK
ncbi:MAG: hypothetical protein RL488_957, partial [Actinomycetota bacterium]